MNTPHLVHMFYQGKPMTSKMHEALVLHITELKATIANLEYLLHNQPLSENNEHNRKYSNTQTTREVTD